MSHQEKQGQIIAFSELAKMHTLLNNNDAARRCLVIARELGGDLGMV